MPTFADFALDPTILKSLERMEYKEPSSIQAEAIPLILQGHDLIALAKTGSGKTAACAIPICHALDIEKRHIQALIIVPTRELALQYATEAQKIGSEKRVKAFAIFGGEDAAMQLSKIKHGVHILIATPGRLIDFIYSRQIDLSHVQTLILDEADEMLGMGFYDDLEFIMQCLNHSHQTLLFSATMPLQINKIAKQHMKNPKEICLAGEQGSPLTIDHSFVYCQHENKGNVLVHLIDTIHPKQAIIFCRSREEVERVCRGLRQKYEGVDFLHAGLGQDIRTIVTGKFRTGKIRLLVATDVASRGLDFSGISHVFIYHLADDPDLYLHRSGRTGRNEKEGVVITLVTHRELPSLQKVLKTIQRDLKWIGDPPPIGSSSRMPDRPKGRGRPPARRQPRTRQEK